MKDAFSTTPSACALWSGRGSLCASLGVRTVPMAALCMIPCLSSQRSRFLIPERERARLALPVPSVALRDIHARKSRNDTPERSSSEGALPICPRRKVRKWVTSPL